MTMIATTIATNKCSCGHASWQHAREGDPRLEVEDFEIGQCYVKGCGCGEFDGETDTATQPAPAASKVVRLGTAKTHGGRGYSIYCKVEYRDGRLSISGVEGPLVGGNALGSCGQIDMHLRSELHTITPAPGWDALKLRQFFNVWQRWHLNDIRAGSQVQEDYLRENPIPKQDYAYPESHYEVASKVLVDAGLNPDPDGYRYGHAWKREEVPSDVLEFLRGLPNADKQPAWV